MSYDYQQERPWLFTEAGQIKFLEVRDKAQALLAANGAFRLDKLTISGGSWSTLACLDRMIELKELVALRDPKTCWAQYQIYTTPEVHNL